MLSAVCVYFRGLGTSNQWSDLGPGPVPYPDDGFDVNRSQSTHCQAAMTTFKYHALSPTGARMDTYVYRPLASRAGREGRKRPRPQSLHELSGEWNDIEQGRLHSVLQSLRRRQGASRRTRSLDHDLTKLCEHEEGGHVAERAKASLSQRHRVHSRSSESLTSPNDNLHVPVGNTGARAGTGEGSLLPGSAGGMETRLTGSCQPDYQHHYRGDGIFHSAGCTETRSSEVDHSKSSGTSSHGQRQSNTGTVSSKSGGLQGTLGTSTQDPTWTYAHGYSSSSLHDDEVDDDVSMLTL